MTAFCQPPRDRLMDEPDCEISESVSFRVIEPMGCTNEAQVSHSDKSG
jgi:hypothetical protein